MPRGVAIPELHERLFQATERLLLRDGPAGLSTRAITTEAGCAKGVLHNHFADLDGFLIQYVMARFQTAGAAVAELPATVGRDTVHHNITAAAAALFETPVLAAHAIVTFRPTLVARLRQGRDRHSPSLADLERVFAGYLDAEKQVGRIAPTTDVTAVALALVATIHHLLMTGRHRPGDVEHVFDRVVVALLDPAVTRS